MVVRTSRSPRSARSRWRTFDKAELDEDIGGSLAAGIVLLLLYVNLYVNEEETMLWIINYFDKNKKDVKKNKKSTDEKFNYRIIYKNFFFNTSIHHDSRHTQFQQFDLDSSP